MRLFVWNETGRLTGYWHDEGGLLVIAESLERARELIATECGKDGKPCEAMEKEPDHSRECAGPELICIHPNAGCC